MTQRPEVEDPQSVFHCITCSDEALPVVVVSVNHETGLASVKMLSATTGANFSERSPISEEVDISLIEMVDPGDVLLVHGGVALSRLEGEDGA